MSQRSLGSKILVSRETILVLLGPLSQNAVLVLPGPLSQNAAYSIARSTVTKCWTREKKAGQGFLISNED